MGQQHSFTNLSSNIHHSKVRESKVEYYEEKQYNIRNNIVTGALIIVYLIVGGIYVYNIEIVKEQFRNMETEEKVKELGLDENIYYFSNKNYPILYIIEGNSTDIHKIYNILEKHDYTSIIRKKQSEIKRYKLLR